MSFLFFFQKIEEKIKTLRKFFFYALFYSQKLACARITIFCLTQSSAPLRCYFLVWCMDNLDNKESKIFFGCDLLSYKRTPNWLFHSNRNLWASCCPFKKLSKKWKHFGSFFSHFVKNLWHQELTMKKFWALSFCWNTIKN